MRFTSDSHHTVKEDRSKTQYDRLELDVCGWGLGGALLPYWARHTDVTPALHLCRSLQGLSASGPCSICTCI